MEKEVDREAEYERLKLEKELERKSQLYREKVGKNGLKNNSFIKFNFLRRVNCNIPPNYAAKEEKDKVIDLEENDLDKGNEDYVLPLKKIKVLFPHPFQEKPFVTVFANDPRIGITRKELAEKLNKAEQAMILLEEMKCTSSIGTLFLTLQIDNSGVGALVYRKASNDWIVVPDNWC